MALISILFTNYAVKRKILKEKKISMEPGFTLRAARAEARMLPLCFAAPLV